VLRHIPIVDSQAGLRHPKGLTLFFLGGLDGLKPKAACAVLTKGVPEFFGGSCQSPNLGSDCEIIMKGVPVLSGGLMPKSEVELGCDSVTKNVPCFSVGPRQSPNSNCDAVAKSVYVLQWVNTQS